GDQNKAIDDILNDMTKGVPMTRLVQGDVGSGKTIVAFLAAVAAIRSGYQVAMMAPTEVLAQQHVKNAEKFLMDHGVSFALLAAAQTDKKKVTEEIAAGKIDLVLGTHALFQEKIVFKNLGLVVVDEQHRFGVDQRN